MREQKTGQTDRRSTKATGASAGRGRAGPAGYKTLEYDDGWMAKRMGKERELVAGSWDTKVNYVYHYMKMFKLTSSLKTLN